MRKSLLETIGAISLDARMARLSSARIVQQLRAFVKRNGASRRARHVDTKIMPAWVMERGQRILNVHGNSPQIAGCFTKIMTLQAAHREALGL